MPTIPAEDEPVLRELGHERVDHAGQVALAACTTARCRSYEAPALQYLGSDRELFRAAEPPCYRLQVAEQARISRRAAAPSTPASFVTTIASSPYLVARHLLSAITHGERRRQPVAAVELRVEQVHEALDERGEHADLAERWAPRRRP